MTREVSWKHEVVREDSTYYVEHWVVLLIYGRHCAKAGPGIVKGEEAAVRRWF